MPSLTCSRAFKQNLAAVDHPRLDNKSYNNRSFSNSHRFPQGDFLERELCYISLEQGYF